MTSNTGWTPRSAEASTIDFHRNQCLRKAASRRTLAQEDTRAVCDSPRYVIQEAGKNVHSILGMSKLTKASSRSQHLHSCCTRYFRRVRRLPRKSELRVLNSVKLLRDRTANKMVVGEESSGRCLNLTRNLNAHVQHTWLAEKAEQLTHRQHRGTRWRDQNSLP